LTLFFSERIVFTELGRPTIFHFRPLVRELIFQGQADVDFSIFKSFPIRERKKVEFRTEIFNILNHPNFSNPGTSLDSASFDQISGTTVNGRIIQFALKLAF